MGLIQKAFGDIITFSRASNATRIGPNGLVEYAPHNLLVYSQEFDNAAWTKTRSSITANAIAAPDGTVTADKLVEDTSASLSHILIRSNLSLTSGTAYTLSAYVKAGERSAVRLLLGVGFSASPAAFFNIANGTITTNPSGNSSTASITAVGNGWYRVSIAAIADSTTAVGEFTITLVTGTNTVSYTGDGTSGLYLWGAQLAVGPLALDYTPTTTAAVYGPRFDYDPVTLAARGLLIEEQRTNLLTYSEQFNNAAWTADNVIKTAGTTTSPDGTVNADSITESATTANHRTYQTLSKAASAITYTASVYAKTNGRNMRLHFDGGTVGNSVSAGFNLSAGTISVAATATGTFSGASATITPVGNGWYQCTVTGTTGTETTVRPNIFVLNGTTDNYTGNGTSGIYVWGAQLEAGAFATSYIPTVASTVTRSADVATINTLSPFFNATEGTMFAQFDSAASGTNTIAAFDDNTANENYRLRNVGTDPKFTVTDGGVDQCDINGGTIAANTVYNFAAAYKANDFAVCIAGGTVQTDTSGTLPTVDRLRIGTSQAGDYLNGHVRRFAYYPRRLANAELQALTA